MQQLIERLQNLPTAQLEAIYNHAWRNAHNEIDERTNNAVLAAIEFVAGRRNVKITGRGGSFEFVANG